MVKAGGAPSARNGYLVTQSEGSPGVLYVVATPIGNLEDITLRALSVLREVDLIACEDTRHTAKLLATHAIRKPTISYFEHNEAQRSQELVRRLLGGESVALVTDAGTPAISDPGYRLVRDALAAAIRVVAVPGPCAVTAALSIAGLPTDRFAFEGFLPSRPGARAAALRRLSAEERTMVFFEGPHRLAATLAAMAAAFGGGRRACLIREITKVHEQSIGATLEELQGVASQAARGEITLIVEGAPKEPSQGRAEAELEMVEELLQAGLSVRDASALVAKLTGVSRRAAYRKAIEAAESHRSRT